MTAILVCVIITALIFEFINGFHDTANAIATSVFTRALTPFQAIAISSVMNFAGALAGTKVAMTVAHGIVSADFQQYVIFGALLGAILWNLFTWWKGIPSSSSHALIGSLVGATIVFGMNTNGVIWTGVLQKVIIPLVTSPFLGLLVGFASMNLIYKLFSRTNRAKSTNLFLKLQVVSAAFVAFEHGHNDAQKTMGIITLALVTNSVIDASDGVPLEVKLACAVMMAAGTALGGRRIMKTMGGGVTKLEPAGGFAAQTSSAIIIAVMSHFGAPISTTQVLTTSVMGVGSAKRASAVKWGTAKTIVFAWIVTLPVTAVLGGICVFIMRLFVG
ncbi:MAG: inorganic phosphate transporter [Clostridiales Family XIII bacterium]|jgi:PiT family inorganic phosphate transporter|nr:inorganic phosphate transporter [Clostridiales Family XIII bacterium]